MGRLSNFVLLSHTRLNYRRVSNIDTDHLRAKETKILMKFKYYSFALYFGESISLCHTNLR